MQNMLPSQINFNMLLFLSQALEYLDLIILVCLNQEINTDWKF